MKELLILWQRHQAKLWLLTVLVGGLLMFNMAAAINDFPVVYQYKTIPFKVEVGDDTSRIQAEFAGTLDREAANGWEFAGRCGHLTGDHFGIDYVVFRRPRR